MFKHLLAGSDCPKLLPVVVLLLMFKGVCLLGWVCLDVDLVGDWTLCNGDGYRLDWVCDDPRWYWPGAKCW